jgi:transposase|tara:strand:+ start:842 stop:1303 length:462 start_codon:yes stop_codon:yes gene_type:complete
MHNDEGKKENALRANGTFNTRAEGVGDPLFGTGEFFDAQDLVQVKYEMLRRVREDGMSVAQAASSFGFSRVAFYEIQRAWQGEGVGGLMPRPRGPKHRHKLTDEVMDFVRAAQSKDATLRAPGLVALVRKRFGFEVHPRSIERALARQAKKGL